MLMAARDAKRFIEGLDEAAFVTGRLHQNAAIRSLQVIGEAAGKISAATQDAHPPIPWREITSMRHRLIHDYAEVRLDLVWSVVRDRLGPSIAELERLFPGGRRGRVNLGHRLLRWALVRVHARRNLK